MRGIPSPAGRCWRFVLRLDFKERFDRMRLLAKRIQARLARGLYWGYGVCMEVHV